MENKLNILIAIIGLIAAFIGLLNAIIAYKTARINKQERADITINNKRRINKLNLLKNKKILLRIFFAVILLFILLISIKYLFFNKDSINEDMVLIKGGSYYYRDQLVKVQNYYISKSEITTEQYLEFIKDNGDNPKFQPQWRDPEINNNPHIFEYYRGFTQDHQPIVGISWYQAKAYCDWLSKKTGKNYHLPSEIQWEYAARAGSGGRFGLGENEEEITYQNLHRYAWFKKDKNNYGNPISTQEVMQKLPNAFGLYEIWGNAAEWTNNDFQNGSKIYKGGSWEDSAELLLTNYRDWLLPSDSKRTISFRVVCEK